MQINLNVIKTISYNHEAVMIKKISSRVSAIILTCGTYLIKVVGVYIFTTLVGVRSFLKCTILLFSVLVLLLLWLWRVGRRPAWSAGFLGRLLAVERGLSGAGSAAGAHGLSRCPARGVIPDRGLTVSPALAGGFLTIGPPGKFRSVHFDN